MRPPWHSHLVPVLLAGVAASTLPALAQKVVVLLPDPTNNKYPAGTSPDHPPRGRDPARHRKLFQFQARLEGGPAQPDHWEWSIVDLDGKTMLPDAGTITAQGLYTPPAVSLSELRMVKIRAVDPGDRSRSGTAVVVIRPHPALTPLEGKLGKGWRGPRLEFLADPGFDQVKGLGYAGRIPRKGAAELQDQWLVLDQEDRYPPHPHQPPALYCVSMTGSLCALAEFPALAEGHPLRFDKVAVKPWTGPQDGAWECFLWDRTRSCIWRLDADGDLSRFSGQPHSEPVQDPEDGSKDTARFGAVWAMVADRQGGLYLSESGSGMSCLRRMAPDGSVRTLARDTGFLPGKPGKATIGLQASLFLDEGTQTLYGTDWTSSGAIYAFDLATDTGRILFKAPALTLLVGLHQGRLVLESDRGLFSAYDPRTGLSTPLFQDAQLRRFHPGPSLGAVAGLAPNKCGSLGPDRRKRAVGGAGQICVVCGPRQLALVLPDWGLPALAPAAGAGTVESKAAPPEKKD